MVAALLGGRKMLQLLVLGPLRVADNALQKYSAIREIRYRGGRRRSAVTM